MKKYAQLLAKFKRSINSVHNDSASLSYNAQFHCVFVQCMLLMHNGFALIVKYAQKVKYFAHQKVLYAAK